MTGICGACYNRKNGMCEIAGGEVEFDDRFDCRMFGMSNCARDVLIKYKNEVCEDD